MPEQMSEERLAFLRRRATKAYSIPTSEAREMITEIDRLREEQKLAVDRAEMVLLCRIWGALAPEGCATYGMERGYCDPLTCDCAMGDFDTIEDFLAWCEALRRDITRADKGGRMSRTRKDGRRGGGHRNHQGKEIWSKRCPLVNMEHPSRRAKTVTHRYERRRANAEAKLAEIATAPEDA